MDENGKKKETKGEMDEGGKVWEERNEGKKEKMLGGSGGRERAERDGRTKEK